MIDQTPGATKRCRKCGGWRLVAIDFPIEKDRNSVRASSWCFSCRADYSRDYGRKQRARWVGQRRTNRPSFRLEVSR